MISWAGRQDNISQSYLQRLWGLVYPFLIYEGISILVLLIYAFVLMAAEPALMEQAGGMGELTRLLSQRINDDYLWLSFFICLLAIPLLLFFMARDRKREVREAFHFEHWQKTDLMSFALCFICGIAACIVLNHVLIYSGIYKLLADGYEETARVLFTGRLLPELLVVGILTPVAEELLFRGLLYRRLRWYLNPRPALLFSALLFGVIHGNLLQGIYAFFLGLLMAFVYERTHSLWAPICIHGGANLVTVLLTDVGAFSRIYEEDGEAAFLLLTAAMMLVFSLAFYLFYVKVRPDRMEPPSGTAPLFPSDQEVQNGT